MMMAVGLQLMVPEMFTLLGIPAPPTSPHKILIQVPMQGFLTPL